MGAHDIFCWFHLEHDWKKQATAWDIMDCSTFHWLHCFQIENEIGGTGGERSLASGRQAQKVQVLLSILCVSPLIFHYPKTRLGAGVMPVSPFVQSNASLGWKPHPCLLSNHLLFLSASFLLILTPHKTVSVNVGTQKSMDGWGTREWGKVKFIPYPWHVAKVGV